MLKWESAGTEEPGDQDAYSGLYSGAWWSLGPARAGKWSVELIVTDDMGHETVDGFSLGVFDTEAQAKAAAEAREVQS